MAGELVTIDGAAKALEQAEQQLSPCGKEHAATCAEILVGSYPNLNVSEPKIYSRAIVSVLADYPKDIASKAVDTVTRRCKFPPSRADVVAACEELAERRRNKLARARSEYRYATEREEERRESARIEADREEFKKRHGGKSPLDVLREKGMIGDKFEKANSNDETDSNEGAVRSGVSAGHGEPGIGDGSRDEDRSSEGGDLEGGRGSYRRDGENWGSRIPGNSRFLRKDG